MIRIELGSVKKDRNISEWRMIGFASCEVKIDGRVQKLESRGDKQNIKLLCAKLLEKGVTGPAEVYRNGTLVFSQPIDIERMAQGKWGKGEKPKHLQEAGK